MISRKILLKQVLLLSSVALAYLKVASCLPENRYDHWYNTEYFWNKKISYINKQVKIRAEFLKRAESIANSEKMGLNFNAGEYIEKGKKIMPAIKDDLESIKTDFKLLKDLLKTLNKVSGSIRKRKNNPNSAIEAACDEPIENYFSTRREINPRIEHLLSIMHNRNKLMFDKIHEFNSEMLDFIEEYSEEKYKDTKMQELHIFRLAKRNKVLPTNIIFTFFEIDAKRFLTDKRAYNKQFEEMLGFLDSLIYDSTPIYTNYIVPTIKEVLDKKTNPLVSANKFFPSVLQDYGLYTDKDDTTVYTYFKLTENAISNEEIKNYRDIAPKQIIKLIMTEHLMDGHLLNYKENCLFSNLEKIVSDMEKTKQDAALNALSVLWNDWYCSSVKRVTPEEFCKNNTVNVKNLRKLKQALIYTIRWVYTIDKSNLEGFAALSREEIAKELHYDLSYLHPMWYMIKRYESIAHLDTPDPNCSSNLFIGVGGKDSLLIVRPHKISKNDDCLIRAENMRDFMNTFTSLTLFEVECFYRLQDADKSQEIYQNFLECLEIPLKIKNNTSLIEEPQEKEVEREFKKIKLSDN
ncbi:hypothetical protein NEMIN01_0940 [Nematocida minor]|uniref:uncharacterized protein n=1 Tax=Nematocida minor TaxID=1912983 RepID=UPI00221F0692|nr:uncharacterized protein NEMIN01_0940 [Nematocida minor]KAI5190241.1 hypothetical protein NEMIN01_0940 [Nematocida minor]